jgi:hypothetical protein
MCLKTNMFLINFKLALLFLQSFMYVLRNIFGGKMTLDEKIKNI